MIKFIDELKKEDLEGKKVLLRADFDVPLLRPNSAKATMGTQGSGGQALKVGEDFRIKAQKETVDYLVNAGAKVLIVAHLGHDDPKATFLPIVEQLGEILGYALTLIPHSELASVHDMFQVSQVLLLDNIRQDPRETENANGLAAELSKGFDYYVNNAFAVCHRRHSSVSTITNHLPSYAGFLIRAETEALAKAISEPAAGKVLVLGGAKIATKLPIIENFADKADKILVGGALANDYFQAQGIDVGDSVVDSNVSPRAFGNNIILPVDVLVTDDMSGKSEPEPHAIKDLDSGYAIMDIGPETAKNFCRIIEKASMVIWNGPMGLYEIDKFKKGTQAITRAVDSVPYAIIGGGDTIAAVESMGLLDGMDFVSTGGGAMLDFLAGNKLPGLRALGYYE